MHQFYRLQNLLVLGVLLLAVSSCVTKKDLLYVQNIENTTLGDVADSYASAIQPGDLLQITVTAQDMKAVQPFNPFMNPNGGGNMMGGNGNRGGMTYQVDEYGDIDFPMLGTVAVAGYKRAALTDLLEEKIGEYVVEPTVLVRVTNNQVTVLGEVGNPGSHIFEGERITLFQALGAAGDLTPSSKRENIRIIREQNGKRETFTVDLTKADFINSPNYFLKQNDIVYVEPNRFKINQTNRSIFGFLTGVSGFLIGLGLLFTN
ncbi:polysaccharide biosynthesis/export family protein [Robertkochia flava]|uniref:polysaccharide biosynthesis/export family protein n=1 Tax=Robertkochia flava TaxID=3447986 RepID=UPI001CC973FD|nr:polysaccharide biosynthesis/export family protein [Robertkochia marina]